MDGILKSGFRTVDFEENDKKTLPAVAEVGSACLICNDLLDEDRSSGYHEKE